MAKKSSCLCSAHFKDSCFEHKLLSLMDTTGKAIELKKRLIKGSVPTRNDVVPYTSPLTDRKRRRVSEVYLFSSHFIARGFVLYSYYCLKETFAVLNLEKKVIFFKHLRKYCLSVLQFSLLTYGERCLMHTIDFLDLQRADACPCQQETKVQCHINL